MTTTSALFWRRATLLSMGVLTSTVALWQLLPRPEPRTAFLAVLLCLPILIVLRGVWRGNRYTYRWSTFCVAPYLVIGLTEVVADPQGRGWSIAILTLALCWFASLIAFLRVTAPVSRDNFGS